MKNPSLDVDGKHKPFGCYIIVLNRENKVDDNDVSKDSRAPKNHYVARRAITSEGYHIRHIPRWAKWLGLRGLWSAIDRMSEGFYFIGRLHKEFEALRAKHDLSPEKHRVRIIPCGDGYVFPKRLFDRRGLRELLEPYS
ncbi:MAG: hypothetical protein ACPLY9_02040 [Nitrososphaerales archaeon]